MHFHGYAPGVKGYLVLNIKNDNLFISRDVIFQENKFPFKEMKNKIISPIEHIITHIVFDTYIPKPKIWGDDSGNRIEELEISNTPPYNPTSDHTTGNAYSSNSLSKDHLSNRENEFSRNLENDTISNRENGVFGNLENHTISNNIENNVHSHINSDKKQNVHLDLEKICTSLKKLSITVQSSKTNSNDSVNAHQKTHDDIAVHKNMDQIQTKIRKSDRTHKTTRNSYFFMPTMKSTMLQILAQLIQYTIMFLIID